MWWMTSRQRPELGVTKSKLHWCQPETAVIYKKYLFMQMLFHKYLLHLQFLIKQLFKQKSIPA